MVSRKIHYLSPTLGYQLCGMGGDLLTLELTSNIEEVTCNHCLNAANKKKRAGGKPSHGDEPKVNITLRIDKKLKSEAKAKDLNCSLLLEEAIKSKLNH